MNKIKLIDGKPYNDGTGISNIELDNMAKKLNLTNFRGTFMSDELPKSPLEHECGIVNSNDHKHNDGHWTCWYKNKDNKYYFDSYGLIPSKEIVNYLKSPILYSTFQIQQFNDANCGEWCLYVLDKLNKGEDFRDIVLKIIDNKTY